MSAFRGRADIGSSTEVRTSRPQMPRMGTLARTGIRRAITATPRGLRHFLVFRETRRYKRWLPRHHRHPWWLTRNFLCITRLKTRIYDGECQSDQGGDTLAGRQGGRPGRASRWPRTRYHLWRRPAAAADFARLCRPAPTHLCRTLSYDHP